MPVVIPPHEVMVDRLLTLYHATDEATREEARQWFPRAWRIAQELRPDDPTWGAAILAALSPRQRWRTNVAAAREFVRSPSKRVSGTPAALDMARRLAAGEAPDDVLKGPKVGAFFRAIAGDPDAVTVDGWIIEATGVDMSTAKGLSHAQSSRVAQAVRDAATRVGEAPRDFQAIVWGAVRGALD